MVCEICLPENVQIPQKTMKIEREHLTLNMYFVSNPIIASNKCETLSINCGLLRSIVKNRRKSL